VRNSAHYQSPINGAFETTAFHFPGVNAWATEKVDPIYDLAITIYYWARVIHFREDDRGVTFTVRIVPRASRSEIVGDHEGALRIRIAAPPVEGAANRELVRLLAKELKVPQNAVEIISGTSSKNKIIRLKGVTANTLAPLQLKWTSPPKKN
jgi:uncharacterized protein (TIGR00251 family)